MLFGDYSNLHKIEGMETTLEMDEGDTYLNLPDFGLVSVICSHHTLADLCFVFDKLSLRLAQGRTEVVPIAALLSLRQSDSCCPLLVLLSCHDIARGLPYCCSALVIRKEGYLPVAAAFFSRLSASGQGCGMFP